MERIINSTQWGGTYTSEFIENNYDIVKDWKFTDVECNHNFIVKKWNGENWYEGATPQENLEYNKPIVPEKISRMKFIIQVFLTTGIMYEDIVLFIQNKNFDEAQKYVILTRLRSATHFDRYSNDLLTIAQMMGITQEQLDNIFINGNLLD